MAGRIQGITVEIGGDTTKLQTALKGVNTEIRNTQSQLRDVDKLLKLDPRNTELLAQKHRLLGDAVKETKEKLETLKTAAEQAEQALKDGTITQEQYDGVQREIVETEQKLKSLEEQARQSGTALQEIAAKGEKLKTVGDNVTNVGKKFMPVTLGVVGLGTSAVKTAADFDSAMRKVATVSSNASTNVSMMGETFKYCAPIAGALGFSAEDTAEAIGLMANAGIKGSQAGTALRTIMNNRSLQQSLRW